MSTRSQWIASTAAGFCCAFVSFPLGQRLSRIFAPASVADIEIGQLPQHLRPEALPAWLDLATYEELYRFGLTMHIPALLIFGAILGAAQYLVLRRLLPQAWPWIVATAIGFPTILVLEVVERHIVIGPTRGPVEPILIVFGGGSLAGLLQWLYLRRQAISDWRYPAFWVGGLVLGVVLAVPAVMGIGTVFGGAIRRLEAAAPHVSWGIEIALFGLIVGAVTGWVSSRGLREIFGGSRQAEGLPVESEASRPDGKVRAEAIPSDPG